MAFIDLATDTPSSIASGSRCFCLTGTAFERAVLYLLNQIAGGTMTIDEIQDNSRCYCLTGISYERAVLYLLAQISQGGGGGGGLPLLSGAGSPLGSVAGAKGQRYYNTSSGTFYTNIDGTVSGWVVG